MKCEIKTVEKRERENNLPYYVIKATHVEGGNVSPQDLFSADGSLNVMGVFSRVQNFTKTIFPPTEAICNALDLGYSITEIGTPVEQIGKTIGLKLIRIPSPCEYNIIDANTGEFLSEAIEVEKVADKPTKVGNAIIKAGETYKVTEMQPKVYKEIQLVVLCDNEENCIEGDEKELAMYQWQRRFGDTWLPVQESDI